MTERDVVDPMCVRLDLLAESGRRRLEVGGRLERAVQVETKVPGAYDAVSAAGISTQWSVRRLLHANNQQWKQEQERTV